MQARASRPASKARPDIPTSRLDREITERREDIARLQEQLTLIESKFETFTTTPSADLTEVQRVLAAVATSCEACQNGLEQEARNREIAFEEFTASMHDSIQKATSALQSEVAILATDIQEIRHAQAQISKAGHRRDENLGSFKEVIQQAQSNLQAEVTAMVTDIRKLKHAQSQRQGAQAYRREEMVNAKEFVGFKEMIDQEIEAVKKRASNQWEHFDAMFAQLNEDVAASRKDIALTRSDVSQTLQTLDDHHATFEDVGKLLNACNDRIDALDENHITERPASLRSTPRSSPRASNRGASPSGSRPTSRSPRSKNSPHGSTSRSAVSVRSAELRREHQAAARGSATPPQDWSDIDGYDTATEISQQDPTYGGMQFTPNIVWSDTASSLPAVDELTSTLIEDCLNAGRSWLK